MYSIWAANNTDIAYTVHQAPPFFVVRMWPQTQYGVY